MVNYKSYIKALLIIGALFFSFICNIYMFKSMGHVWDVVIADLSIDEDLITQSQLEKRILNLSYLDPLIKN